MQSVYTRCCAVASGGSTNYCLWIGAAVRQYLYGSKTLPKITTTQRKGPSIFTPLRVGAEWLRKAMLSRGQLKQLQSCGGGHPQFLMLKLKRESSYSKRVGTTVLMHPTSYWEQNSFSWLSDFIMKCKFIITLNKCLKSYRHSVPDYPLQHQQPEVCGWIWFPALESLPALFCALRNISLLFSVIIGTASLIQNSKCRIHYAK